MIDFHTHILPMIDDGSQSIEQSLEMLKMLKKQGVETVVLTPHYYPDEQNIEEFLDIRNRQYKKLCEATAGGKYPQLRLGAEVMLDYELSNLKDLDRLCIEGTNFLLLEMPYTLWSSNHLDCINHILATYNIVPVIAHIDRYLKLHNPKLIDEVLNMEVLVQCNADSLVNLKTRWTMLKMLKHGKIHFIGSDCHNTTTRKPNMEKAMKVLKTFAKAQYNEFSNDDFDGFLMDEI